MSTIVGDVSISPWFRWGRGSLSGQPGRSPSPRSVTSVAVDSQPPPDSQLDPSALAGGLDQASAQTPLWARIVAIGESLSPDARARIPRDLAAEHDHYIYGTPKRGE